MLCQSNMVVYTIYTHEEEYAEMYSWLKSRGEVTDVFAEDNPSGEKLGFKAILDEFTNIEFRKKFDLCDFSEAVANEG